jgi:hypothetical protein
MQDDYKRLARAFDKSTINNFPTHEVESKEKCMIYRLQIGTTNPNHFMGCRRMHILNNHNLLHKLEVNPPICA